MSAILAPLLCLACGPGGPARRPAAGGCAGGCGAGCAGGAGRGGGDRKARACVLLLVRTTRVCGGPPWPGRRGASPWQRSRRRRAWRRAGGGGRGRGAGGLGGRSGGSDLMVCCRGGSECRDAAERCPATTSGVRSTQHLAEAPAQGFEPVPKPLARTGKYLCVLTI